MHNLSVLGNGVRVATMSMPATFSVSLGLFLGVGSRYEREEESGISHFIEHMSFKGTKRRPSVQEITEAIESVGGVMNASTSPEYTAYWVKVPRPHLDLALDILVDILRDPLFDPTEMEKERQVIIEELHMVHDMPDEWVGVLFHRAMWPDHPLGRDTGGSEETVRRLTREDLLRFCARSYAPHRLVVGVAGDVKHDEVVERVAGYLGDWSADEDLGFLPVSPLPKGPHVNVEARDTQQVQLLLGVRGVSRRSRDRFAVGILSVILGQGMSSRLSLEIRERLGLAYSVGCFASYLTDTGAVMVSAGVAPENGPRAIQAILGELKRIQDEPVPDGELNRAKEYTKGRLMLRMEDTFANASWVGQQEVLDHRILTLEQVLKEIDAVRGEDIQRLARELFRPERLVLAAVGPKADPERLRNLLVW